MPISPLTRITVLLPQPFGSDHVAVVEEVIQSLALFCGGVTASLSNQAHFAGSWYDELDGRIKGDELLFIFADAPYQPKDARLTSYLDELKLDCQYRLREQVIWITVNAVDRITTGDYIT